MWLNLFLIGLLYFIFLSGLSSALLWVGFLVGKRSRSVGREPLSPYECGFQSMGSARIPFSLKFYLLGIIFLLFDVELVVAFPYFMIPEGGEGMFVFLYLFFMILLVGLVHETNEGSLEWR